MKGGGRQRPIKIRKNWGPIKPITKIVDSDKLYDRNKDKTDWLNRQHKEFGVE